MRIGFLLVALTIVLWLVSRLARRPLGSVVPGPTTAGSVAPVSVVEQTRVKLQSAIDQGAAARADHAA